MATHREHQLASGVSMPIALRASDVYVIEDALQLLRDSLQEQLDLFSETPSIDNDVIAAAKVRYDNARELSSYLARVVSYYVDVHNRCGSDVSDTWQMAVLRFRLHGFDGTQPAETTLPE